MKKIALCSMLMALFYGVGCFAAEIHSCGDVSCRTYTTGGSVEQGRCQGKGANALCTSAPAGEKKASCMDLGGKQLSCAAEECSDGYALWLTNSRGGTLPQSQGRCFLISKMDSWCREGDCDCGGKKGVCVFNEYKGTYLTRKDRFEAPEKTKAFVGEEACVCVFDEEERQEEQKPNVCPEKDCKDTCDVTINESIKCNNGKKFESKKTVKVCKECVEQQNMTCDQYQETINKCDDLKCIENRLKQLTEIDKLLKEWCGAGYSTTTPDNSAQITAAKNTVSSFFGSAESNKSVWKDAQGNFNTARLASDLTAGVVLGTVGGVVSGVVIKKKQIEKGFDALHCAVGGQTVADLGDTFNVGLRR